jgi:hypothetical protein
VCFGIWVFVVFVYHFVCVFWGDLLIFVIFRGFVGVVDSYLEVNVCYGIQVFVDS